MANLKTILATISIIIVLTLAITLTALSFEIVEPNYIAIRKNAFTKSMKEQAIYRPGR